MISRRDGFTLIEAIVSIVLLGIVLTSLAGLSIAAARTAVKNGDEAAIRAHSLELVNRYMALPWDSVHTVSRCADVGDPGSRYRRCVTGERNLRTATITVVVTPLQRVQRPDTVRFVRTQS